MYSVAVLNHFTTVHGLIILEFSLFPIFPKLLKRLAGWLHFLSLQSRLYHVKWVGYEASKATCGSSTDKVPEVGMLLLPGSNHSFQVLVDTDNATRKWDVH